VLVSYEWVDVLISDGMIVGCSMMDIGGVHILGCGCEELIVHHESIDRSMDGWMDDDVNLLYCIVGCVTYVHTVLCRGVATSNEWRRVNCCLCVVFSFTLTVRQCAGTGLDS
jgi:hypothetical protein